MLKIENKNKKMKRIIVTVPAELHKLVKLLCIKEDLGIKDVVTMALLAYFEELGDFQV